MTMKRAKSIFLCLLFCVLFCSSQALAIDLYGFGSYWDKNDVDGTWGVGLGLSLPLFTEHLRLDGRAHFFEDNDLGTDDLKLTPFDLGLQVHLLPNGTVDPYILGGVSYVYVDSDISGYIGVGLDVALGIPLVKIFGEFLYRANKIEKNFGEDIDVSGITGNIGLKLHF